VGRIVATSPVIGIRIIPPIIGRAIIAGSEESIIPKGIPEAESGP
jgi:hypothetical protein